MTLAHRLADAVTTHSRLVLVVLCVVTLLVGAGALSLEEDTSLEQFETDSPEAEAAAYVAANFSGTEAANTTAVQVVVVGENALSRESLLDGLRLQEALADDDTVGPTLHGEDPIVGVENVLATRVVRGAQAEALEARATDLEARAADLDATATRLERGLDETAAIQREYDALNRSYESGEVDEESYAARAGALERAFAERRTNATADLETGQVERYERAQASVRSLTRAIGDLEDAHEAGEVDGATYEHRRERYEDERDGAYASGVSGILAAAYDDLQTDRRALEADRDALLAAGQPPLADQREALAALDDEEFATLLAETLSGEGETAGTLELVSSTYEPGSQTAPARTLVLTQSAETGGGVGTLEESVIEAQLEVRDLANGWSDDRYAVFGAGIVSEELDRSMADSLAVVGPVAFVFVVLALFVAYRDVLDIVLGVSGIVVVLVWTVGFMGWAGIAVNQLFVAIPVLLIGLSIDYAIHVFMRGREHREGGTAARAGGVRTIGSRQAMALGLAGVGVALVWVTATTATGFLSNLVSPVRPVREFGLVSAVGICSALVVFGTLVPAAKVELDSLLESRGVDRRRRAFGTGGGRLEAALGVGARAAHTAPAVLVVVVLVLTAGGVYGATQVDTSFDEEEFVAEQPPAWTDHLGPLSPGEYHARSDLEIVDRHVSRENARTHVLVRGDVTDSETLERAAAAETSAANATVAYVLANEQVAVEGPLSVIRAVAAEDESFAATVDIADTTGDGVPNRNLGRVYDALFDADETAAREVIYRNEEGEYEALRVGVSVRGDATLEEVSTELRAVAAGFEEGEPANGGDPRWSATATGDPVVSHVVERDLFETVLESLLVTLVAVFGLLTLGYWAAGKGATLGAVTLVPVAVTVSWILGTMSLLEIPFNVLTGTITSLTVGLGVAYSIHVSSRYTLELERRGDVEAAMAATVTGTGGALLGSAATTVGGFATLSLAMLPVLRQFGLLTAVAIGYAFLASVVVLPTLLVLWTRYAGPARSSESTPPGRS
ncbi:efflux RND transporter permease subunit [Natronobiforma cellulositropha]|uniref:efflux RND transporter permease subunit n=1 Tax=Natronobiforma cellulositropha TaxID=1679076 RepID=UPI0021D58BA7|nr:MMPL family transporter [Natronobiforma cellulositropha]